MEKTLKKIESPKLTMLEFLDKVNKSDVRRRLIPMELSYGWPSVSVKKNGEICITMFYFGMQRIPNTKQIQLLPVSYTISALWKSGKIVDYKCLSYDKNFSKAIDFSKPCGVFPHKALSEFNAEKYKQIRKRVFELYDELISCISEKRDFNDEKEFIELLSVMMEPGHYPIYQAVAPKFFTHYCNITL